MSVPPQPDLAPAIGIPEIDVVVAWRHADAESRSAYDAWCDAPASRKTESYFVYLAAADRERAAADALDRAA